VVRVSRRSKEQTLNLVIEIVIQVRYVSYDLAVHTYHGTSGPVLRAVTGTKIKSMAIGKARRESLIWRKEHRRIRDDLLHQFEAIDRNDRRQTVGFGPIIFSYHTRLLFHVLAHAAGDNEREVTIDGAWRIVSWQGAEEKLREHAAKRSIIVRRLDVLVAP
jgi:hypothetical protein